MALLLLLALFCITAKPLCAVAAYHPLDLPAFSLSELQTPNADTLQRVGDAISSLGMLALTGVDDVAHQTLSTFASCALRGDLDLRQVQLDDGALRRTLATSTNLGTPEPLPAPAAQHCPDFASNANKLRAAVAAAGKAYAGVLDSLLYGNEACTTPDNCFSQGLHDAESLEHFHLFEPSASPSAEHMLAMHSDIGLFLIMTPAELFARSHKGASSDAQQQDKAQLAHDLLVQLPDGRIVTPALPDGALLVMNGEGLTRWMRAPSPGHVRPYSPMHEVLSSDLSGGVRAWFGRMFMPRHSARLQVADGGADADGQESSSTSRLPMSFAEYRQHTYELFNRGDGYKASTAGCSPVRRMLVDESSCGADQVYCWMSCMTIPANMTCGKSDIMCANIKNTSMLWPRDYINPATFQPTHCKDCTIMCPASTGPASTSSFCNTALGPTSMWMTGFQFMAGNHLGPCVVYLFPEWVLDTEGKFAGACIGTFSLGVLVGLLGWARNRLRDRWVVEGRWEPGYQPLWHTWSADAVLITIIAVQVCLGYWLMLVAMTYQAELFIMVVLGLAMGHLFYRYQLRKPVAACPAAKLHDKMELGEKLEPCCVASMA